MRMASLGQASTQNPQTTQRSSSMTNCFGYFSMGSPSTSAASMKMHWAGQAVAHM